MRARNRNAIRTQSERNQNAIRRNQAQSYEIGRLRQMKYIRELLLRLRLLLRLLLLLLLRLRLRLLLLLLLPMKKRLANRKATHATLVLLLLGAAKVLRRWQPSHQKRAGLSEKKPAKSNGNLNTIGRVR